VPANAIGVIPKINTMPQINPNNQTLRLLFIASS
jgi:hypothetical protein